MQHIKYAGGSHIALLLAGWSALAAAPAVGRAEQFVLFDVTFTYTKDDADHSKPSKSHYYVRGKMLNPDRPKDWTKPVDYRNGTVHIRAEVLEKPPGGEPTTWTLCYIPNKGQKNGYGCTGTVIYREKGVYERDVKMTEFWQNDSIVWSEGIKQMDLVIKDDSGGAGHAHKRADWQKFFPTKMRITMVQVSAGCKYDPSLVPNLQANAGGVQGDAQAGKKTIRAADGLNIVCEVRGQGDTALVFLHGWCGDRDYWKHQVDAFAGDYKVVTLDQAGHGESGKDRQRWSVSALAGDVEAVVGALGLKRVILVGHSMGGPVALAAAQRLPGVVVAVIGVDTLQNVELKAPEELRKKIVEGFEADFKGTMRAALPSMLPANVPADLSKWLITRAESQDPKMAVGLMRDMGALDTKTLLKDAKVPVRCINSAGGFQFFTPTAVAVNRKYADYDAVTIEAVGHYPMLEKPAEFNQKLREILKELAAKK